LFLTAAEFAPLFSVFSYEFRILNWADGTLHTLGFLILWGSLAVHVCSSVDMLQHPKELQLVLYYSVPVLIVITTDLQKAV